METGEPKVSSSQSSQSSGPYHVPSVPFRLGAGHAFPDMLPDVSLEAAAAAHDFRTEVLQYGPLLGLPELRDEIVRFIAQDGVHAERDNIIVLTGAKQALDLTLRTFVGSDDSVIVTRPCYATAVHIIGNQGASIVEIDMDGGGMKVDELQKTLEEMRSQGQRLPKLLYDVPDFHNPTGITLAEDRRRKLVDLANAFDFYILEDDPYRRIRFDGTPVPPIKSFDKHGRVIAAGTFSKIFGPGIRVGWANADPDIVNKLALRKTDGGTCPFTQRIILQCLTSGKIDEHIRKLNPVMKSHRDAMLHAVQKYLPDTVFRQPEGGYYMWLELPARIDGNELMRMAEPEGVGIFSGRGYFASDPPSNFIRLCYATSTESQIEEGVSRLGKVFRRMHNRADSGTYEPTQNPHFD